MDTILLVEDNGDDVLFMKRALAKAKMVHRLFVVSRGQEAIEYLSGVERYSDRAAYPPPRLILLDLSLPDLTGFDVLRWIRQQPAHVDRTVLILSSSELPSDIEQAYALGANSFLSKPSDPSKLTELMQSVAAHWLRLTRDGLQGNGSASSA